jgi:hypothetical protein
VNGDRLVGEMRCMADAAGAAFTEVADESGSDECKAMLPPILDWIETCQRSLQ